MFSCVIVDNKDEICILLNNIYSLKFLCEINFKLFNAVDFSIKNFNAKYF